MRTSYEPWQSALQKHVSEEMQSWMPCSCETCHPDIPEFFQKSVQQLQHLVMTLGSTQQVGAIAAHTSRGPSQNVALY